MNELLNIFNAGSCPTVPPNSYPFSLLINHFIWSILNKEWNKYDKYFRITSKKTGAKCNNQISDNNK